MFEYFFYSSAVEVKSPTIKEDTNGFLVVDNKIEKSNTQNNDSNNKSLQSRWTRNSEGRLIRA
jgi:hypothetical protein